MRSIPKEFATTPIVYAVRNEYQILVPVTCETVMWVRVGEHDFYDDSTAFFDRLLLRTKYLFRRNCLIGRKNIPSVTA